MGTLQTIRLSSVVIWRTLTDPVAPPTYPLDVITWCALPFSPSAGLKRQPEHFLSNGSGEALRLAESSHG